MFASQKLTDRPQETALIAAAALVTAGPVAWIVRTWLQPGFNDAGPWVAAAVVAMVLRSVLSGPAEGAPPRAALVLLAASATARALAVALGIDVLGGVTLVLDAWALASWLRLDRRPLPVSPAGIAALMALALPVERLLQRLLGYPLQALSAKGACALAHLSGGDVACAGIELVVDGARVVVDLPCSGAQGLHIVLVALAIAAAHVRPSRTAALVGVAVALSSSLASNAARIAWVAVAAAHPWLALGADATRGIAHQVIGAVALAAAVGGVAVWARRVVPAQARGAGVVRRRVAHPALVVATLTVAVGTWALATVPGRTLDRSASPAPLHMPAQVGGRAGTWLPLRDVEARAYTEHGGTAQRVSYGALTALVVQTTSPLRHLHDPGECLRAMGWRVERVGLHEGPLPGGLYHATDVAGRAWVVRVAFVSSSGDTASSVPEAIWRWAHDPGATWTAVQRLAPAGTAIATLDDADRAFAAAVGWPEVDAGAPGPGDRGAGIARDDASTRGAQGADDRITPR